MHPDEAWNNDTLQRFCADNDVNVHKHGITFPEFQLFCALMRDRDWEVFTFDYYNTVRLWRDMTDTAVSAHVLGWPLCIELGWLSRPGRVHRDVCPCVQPSG